MLNDVSNVRVVRRAEHFAGKLDRPLVAFLVASLRRLPIVRSAPRHVVMLPSVTAPRI
jgi:hypothetical protein